MKTKEAYTKAIQSGKMVEYNNYSDSAYTNNPNKVHYYEGTMFVKFGIICNVTSKTSFVEGTLYESYTEAETELLSYFDSIQEALDNDTAIGIVTGETRLYEGGTEEVIIEDWEVINKSLT